MSKPYRVQYHSNRIDAEGCMEPLYEVVDGDGVRYCDPLPYERARSVKYGLEHGGGEAASMSNTWVGQQFLYGDWHG